MPLIAGATIACYPSPLHYEAIAERARFHRRKVTFGTDTFLSGSGRRADPQEFASVRAAIVAGAEPGKGATRALLLERLGVPLFERYGATEASPVVALKTPAVARQAPPAGSSGDRAPLEPISGIDDLRLPVRGP